MSTCPSVSIPRSWASVPRPTPSTSPAMSMPTPVCRATTPPAPSGAPLRASPSRRPVAPCSGPSRRPRPSAACTSTAILSLHQNHGWASGGWMSDTLVDGNVDSGSQQQWIARNSQWGSWTGSNWNMVFVGDLNPPPGEWPSPPYTKVARVPIRAREALSLCRCARKLSCPLACAAPR